MPYFTVAKAFVREETIKGSSFIACVTPVKNLAEAHAKLRAVRAAHEGATHVPWAYRIGGEVRFSDDGEPGGTAGRPMLEVLAKRELDYVLGTVTRYFGGTKLGAGGLVRAYSGSLAKALDEAGRVEVKETLRRTVLAPFAELDAVHRLLDAWVGLKKGDAEYTADGLRLKVVLFADDEKALRDALPQATRGEARLTSA